MAGSTFFSLTTARASGLAIASSAPVSSKTFLSLRPVAPKAEDEWTLLQYALSGANHLSLGLVDPEPFEDVLDDAVAVRERLAERLDDPEVIREQLSCTRQGSLGEQPE